SYGAFSWTGPLTNSPGQLNTGQTIPSCRGVTVISYVDSFTPGSCANAGTITRTWTARDSSGNTSSGNQTITISDTTPPLFTVVPTATTIQCNQPTDPANTGGFATATDACDTVPGLGSVWINEFHYDNSGTDQDFVELAGVAGTSLTNYSVVLYDGSSGQPYLTLNPSGTIPDEGCGFGAVSISVTLVGGLQNGPQDGLALVHKTRAHVVEFLSYEGTMTALTGVAAGMTSVDVGVQENSSTSISFSLQRTGTGNNATSFSWIGPTQNSPGTLNAVQTLTPCAVATHVTYSDSSTKTSNGSCTDFGYTITRTWTAADHCGNASQASQVIHVVDTTAPVISALPAP